MKSHPNRGSTLDAFLEDEGIRAEVEVAALKRIIALQIEDEMRRRHLTKSALAKRMKTSRVTIDRLLDASNTSLTLATLGNVASALGRRLRIEFA
jgi:hypothetical protein